MNNPIHRGHLAPIISKIASKRPMVAHFCDLWRIAFDCNPQNNNLAEFERVIFNEARQGAIPFLTPNDARIIGIFDRGETAIPVMKEKTTMSNNYKVEISEPEGNEIGDMFTGAHWSPLKSTAELVEASEHPESFSTKTIAGEVRRVVAYGREAFAIKPIGAPIFFLLPDHTALYKRLKHVDDGASVWIGFKGMEKTQNGREFAAYSVKRTQ
jgi:hypothetical protein